MRRLKKYAVGLLLASTFFIAELHNFWAGDPRMQNWIVAAYKPMTIQWNVKYASDQLNWILIIFAMFLYGFPFSRNRFNHEIVIIYLAWVIFDTVLYFYNFKTVGYGVVYLCLGAIIALVHYLWKTFSLK